MGLTLGTYSRIGTALALITYGSLAEPLTICFSLLIYKMGILIPFERLNETMNDKTFAGCEHVRIA